MQPPRHGHTVELDRARPLDQVTLSITPTATGFGTASDTFESETLYVETDGSEWLVGPFEVALEARAGGTFVAARRPLDIGLPGDIGIEIVEPATLPELARTEVLILDDWGTGSLDAITRANLLEVVDDRAGHRATIITHQLPVEHWHGWIGDATIADAILDRLLPKAHRFNLEGPSRRGPRAAKASGSAPKA